MRLYPWAQNREKLERAIGELGVEASEEAIKIRYIEMAGKVLADDGTPGVPTETEDKTFLSRFSKETPKKSKKK